LLQLFSDSEGLAHWYFGVCPAVKDQDGSIDLVGPSDR
jgi:hypothetical protein